MSQASGELPVVTWLFDSPADWMLQTVSTLLSKGYVCRVHCPEGGGAQAECLTKNPAFESSTGRVQVREGWEQIEPCELAFATSSRTAFALLALTSPKRRAYLVGEFEPWLSPMGDGFLKAEHSYRIGLSHVTKSRWLAHQLAGAAAATARILDLSVDSNTYSPGAATKNPHLRVAAFYDPDSPESCPWILRQALGMVKHRVPNCEIVVHGCTRDTSGWWFDHTHVRELSPAAAARLFASSHVGVSLSSTKPSERALEMMASGCAVVDLDLPNNRFDYDAGTISLAPPSPEGIAETIVRMLQDERARATQIERAFGMVSRRGQAQYNEQIISVVESLICNDVVPSLSADEGKLDRPSIASFRAAMEQERLRSELVSAQVELERTRAALKEMRGRLLPYESLKGCGRALARLVARRLAPHVGTP